MLLAVMLGERGKEISEGAVFDKFTHATSEVGCHCRIIGDPAMIFHWSLWVAIL